MITLSFSYFTLAFLWFFGVVGFYLIYTGMNFEIMDASDHILAITQAIVWPLALPGVPLSLLILNIISFVFGAFFIIEENEDDDE